MKYRLPPSPLSSRHVLAIMASRAVERPLAIDEITDMCQAAHPNFPGISTARVYRWLRYLEQHGRVRRIPGADTEQLDRLGVSAPRTRWNYWIFDHPTTNSRHDESERTHDP